MLSSTHFDNRFVTSSQISSKQQTPDMTRLVMRRPRVINWLILSLFCIALKFEIEAQVFSGIQDPEVGPKEYLRHLYTGDNYVLIGGRSYLYNVSLPYMQLNKAHQWINGDREGNMCRDQHYSVYDWDCYNYVMSAVKKTDDLFVICADAGVESLCKRMNFEGNDWVLTSTNIDVSDYPEYVTPWLYAPPWQWTQNVIHKSAEGVDYGMTMTLARGYIIDNYYIVRSATSSRKGLLTKKEFIATDGENKQLSPSYSGMFDTDVHVYLLHNEPATETFTSTDTERAQYSRIGRVCKNDNGETEESYYFTSFFKTRILCGLKSETFGQRKSVLKEYEGYYQTYIDVIQDNSQPHVPSHAGADGEKIIFALFSTPKGAPIRSAICSYRLSDIETSFITNKVVNGTNIVQQDDPTKCVIDSYNMTQTEKDIRKLPRLAKPVRAVDNDVMLFEEDLRMTRMVVDWHVESADGKRYDVIFVATDDGRLLKLAMFKYGSEDKARYHIIHDSDIFYNLPIHQLKITTDELGKKHLLLSSFADVKIVPIERCHHYTTCQLCITMRDPYCGWSADLGQCVSITDSVSDMKADIEGGWEDVSICK